MADGTIAFTKPVFSETSTNNMSVHVDCTQTGVSDVKDAVPLVIGVSRPRETNNTIDNSDSLPKPLRKKHKHKLTPTQPKPDSELVPAPSADQSTERNIVSTTHVSTHVSTTNLNVPGAGWTNEQFPAKPMCSSPSCDDTNCNAPTAQGTTPPLALSVSSITKGTTVRPLADFATPDSDTELLEELEGHIMISKHHVSQEVIEEWLKSMKEEEAWNECFANGSRLSSGKVESFHSLVTDQASPIRLEPAANLKDTLTANGGVAMNSWATGYNPHPETACKMDKHADKHAQHYIHSVLTMGDSLAEPLPQEKSITYPPHKTITFFKQVYSPNTGHYEESKSVTFKLPHGTLISMDAQGSGADSEMQREAKQPYFMHQVDNGCGTYALFFQFCRSCTEAKEVNIQELRGVFHSALPPVDPQKSGPVHITSEHFDIPAAAAVPKAYFDNPPTPVRYSGTLKALNDGFNKTCFEE